MNMLKDDEIAEHFNKNLTYFFSTAQKQRDEIYRSELYMNCRSPLREGQKPRKHSPIPLLPAIVRGVSGSDAMQERSVDVVPLDGADYDIDADIMDDAVEYAQYASEDRIAYSLAKRDVLSCGIGATVTYLDMSKREYASGVPQSKRIYPGFVFFDNSKRGNDINATANYMGYGDLMTLEALEEYVQEKRGNDEFTARYASASSFIGQFLERFTRTDMELDMLYHYFWRDYITVYDVQNPIADGERPSILKEAIANDPIPAELMGQWADEVGVDINAPYWTLDKDEYKELEDIVGALAKMLNADIALESSKRKVWCYYRAEIAFGMVLSKSKSYSQTEYPMDIMTGYYDEIEGIYYGLARPLSFPQDAFDEVMEDLQEYSHSAATGGKIYIKGAADELKRIIKEKTNEHDVTPIPQNAEIIAKELASSPQVLMQLAQMLMEIMPRAIGIGQEFLGVITSGTMTDSLYGKVVKQSFAVLEDFSLASAGRARRQAQRFLDLMLSMAKAEEGRILPILSPGHQGNDYIRLTKDNIARQYIIRLRERPVSDDQKQETLKILLQLSPQFAESGVNILPTIIKSLPLDYDDRMELIQLATPQPTPPDPLNTASIQANINLLNAQAKKLLSDAAEKEATIAKQAPLDQSEIIKNLAMADKYQSDARSPKNVGTK